MGQIEEKSRKHSKRKGLQQLILDTVATVGILSIGMLAPNVIGAMAKLGIIPNKRQKEYIGSSASKMLKKGLLKYNGKFYELTSLGKKILRRWEFSNFKFNKSGKWDGKWRVIIFDIPDEKRRARDHIRYLFRSAGFYLLQESVWVYPYDCEDIITLLKTDFGVGKNLLYLIAEEIENDKHLREYFKLL